MSDEVRACSREGCGNVADRAFCVDCEGRIRQALGDLPGLWESLREELEPSSRPGLPVSGSKDPPAPLNVQAAALRDDIEGWLKDQVTALRHEQGYDVEPHPRLWSRPYRVVQRSAWLTRHLAVLLAAPFGATAGVELLDLHFRARSLLGLLDPPDRLPAPCFVCDMRALVRHNGESQVRCEPKAGGCGRRWQEQEYEWLVHSAATGLVEPERPANELRLASGWDGSGGRG
jgi:hypothetical protein